MFTPHDDLLFSAHWWETVIQFGVVALVTWYVTKLRMSRMGRRTTDALVRCSLLTQRLGEQMLHYCSQGRVISCDFVSTEGRNNEVAVLQVKVQYEPVATPPRD